MQFRRSHKKCNSAAKGAKNEKGSVDRTGGAEKLASQTVLDGFP
jgi:hypothetical protein